MSIEFSSLLSTVPTTLKDELINAFTKIERNFKESRWEPSELNGGKLCEVVYTILKGYVDDNYPASASKPKNMVNACRNLEQSPWLMDTSQSKSKLISTMERAYTRK